MSRYKHVVVDGVMKQAHRVIWEEAYGPIPAGYDIHHKDNNPHNNSLDNLMCMTHAEHLALHAKQREAGTEPEPTQVVIDDRAKLRESYAANRKRRIARQTEYYNDHKEEIRAQRARHYAEHRTEIQAADRKRYAENRETISERGKVYRANNREKVAARKAKFYREHKDDIIAYQKKYREENRDAIKQKRSQYYRDTIDARRAYNQEHKEEATAYARIRYARKSGKPQEVIDRLCAEYEELKARKRAN